MRFKARLQRFYVLHDMRLLPELLSAAVGGQGEGQILNRKKSSLIKELQKRTKTSRKKNVAGEKETYGGSLVNQEETSSRIRIESILVIKRIKRQQTYGDNGDVFGC